MSGATAAAGAAASRGRAADAAPAASRDSADADADSLADALAARLGVRERTASPVPRAPSPAQPRHLLILDVNGLLLDRRREPAPGNVPPDLKYPMGRFYSYVYDRPHAAASCAWALARFRVAVWSSAQAHILAPLVQHVFGSSAGALAFVWSQAECSVDGTVATRGARVGTKPRFLKELQRVFAARLGTPTTTLLVDDDPYKATRNPPHTALHPAPYEVGDRERDNALGEQWAIRMLLQRLADAPSVPDFIAINALPAGAVADVAPQGAAAAR